jgi:hypothetical protein
VSPAFPSLSCLLPLVQAHLLTPSVRFVPQQIERGVANPKHIVAPRSSSRPLLPPLEKIEAAVVTIGFLSSLGTSSLTSSPRDTTRAMLKLEAEPQLAGISRRRP